MVVAKFIRSLRKGHVSPRVVLMGQSKRFGDHRGKLTPVQQQQGAKLTVWVRVP